MPFTFIDIPTAADLSVPGALQTYADACVANKQPIRLPPGEISQANALYIDDDSTIVEGMGFQYGNRTTGTVLKSTNPSTPVIQIRNALCCTIKNLGVRQPAQTVNNTEGVGISLEGSIGSLVFHTKIENVGVLWCDVGVRVSEPTGTRVDQAAAADVVINHSLFQSCDKAVEVNNNQSPNVHLTNQCYFYDINNVIWANNGGRFLVENCCGNPARTILRMLKGGGNLAPSVIRNWYADRTGGAAAPIIVDARGCPDAIRVLIDVYSMSYNSGIDGPYDQFIHNHIYLPDGNPTAANNSIVRFADPDFAALPGNTTPINAFPPTPPPEDGLNIAGSYSYFLPPNYNPGGYVGLVVSLYYLTSPGVKNLYMYPVDRSLADWTTYRIPLIEEAEPNTGRYAASVLLDKAHSEWAVFASNTQPAEWSEQIGTVKV